MDQIVWARLSTNPTVRYRSGRLKKIPYANYCRNGLLQKA